jgi:hypothetical protein
MSQASTPARILPPRNFLPELGDRNRLSAHGIEVSPFCVGMVSDENVIPAAFDAGINFFFVTADMHWPLYEKTRRGLAQLFRRGGGVRDEVVVGVVSYATQPEFCVAPFQELLDEVPGLERVDLAIAGGAYAHEICDRLCVYEARHRRESYLGCRAIGVTFHDRRAALLVTNRKMVDISFIRYSAAHPGARQDLFPYLDANDDTLVYNFKSMGGYVDPVYFPQLDFQDHHWQPKATDHYRFILTRPEIGGVLCALTEVPMVRELADAMAEGPLDEDEENFLIRLAATAQQKAGRIIPIDPGTGKPAYYSLQLR